MLYSATAEALAEQLAKHRSGIAMDKGGHQILVKYGVSLRLNTAPRFVASLINNHPTTQKPQPHAIQ